MNSVLFPTCSLAPSCVMWLGTPKSEINSLSAWPLMDFDSIRYEATKNCSVANTCAVEISNTRLLLISCSQGILSSSSFSCACLHVSFTAYENFYKLSKMHCHLVLIFHFLILRMSEYKNPTIQHIFTYTLASSFITKYVIDLFLGSNPHSKIPF